MALFHNFWAKDDSTTRSAYHSAAYHSFFEGYVERKQTDPKTGKPVIVRVYTAEYIRRSGTDRQWVCNKIMVTAVYFLILAIYLLGSMQLSLNRISKYFELLPAIGIIFYFYLFYVLIKFLIAPRKMTVGEYKAYTPGLCRAFRLIAVVSFLDVACAVMELAAGLVLNGDFETGLLLSVLCYAVCSAGMFFLYHIEYNAVYDHLENESSDEGGIMIRD